MKILAIVFLLLFISVKVHAADISITIVIPEEKIQRVKDGFLKVRAIPDNDKDGVLDYTAEGWLEKCIHDFVKGTVLEGENRMRHKIADDNVNNEDVTE